jgi:hypothetical protein
LTTYTLNVELFTYEGENIDTGISDIDKVEDLRKSYAILAILPLNPIAGSTGNTIFDGEPLYQVLGVTGVGATLSAATSTAISLQFIKGTTQSQLYITGISGTISYAATQTIKGAVSGAEYYLTGSSSVSNIVAQKDPNTGLNVVDNDQLQSSGIDIFDFTDIDPFSEGKY